MTDPHRGSTDKRAIGASERRLSAQYAIADLLATADSFEQVVQPLLEAVCLQTERRLRVQYAVTRALSAAGSLDEAAPEILRSICESVGWGFGGLWTVDRELGVLRLVASWRSPKIPPSEGARLDARDPNHEVGVGQGLPGRAWANGQIAWTEDPDGEPEFIAADWAEPVGFHGALAFPILRADGVVGVLEFDAPLAERPDLDLLDLLSAAGAQIGQFVGRQEVERAILESEAIKGAILGSALDCIVATDAEGRILEFNPAAERTFGYERADVIGLPMAELIVPPSLREEHHRGFARHLDTGETRMLGRLVEMVAMRSDGSEFPVEISVTRVDLASGPLFTGYLRDISERKRAEEEIARLAYHDKLTGLPNRARFEEELETAITRAQRDQDAVAVLNLDLDNFKLVNDGLGHTAGDELLRQVAGRLTALSVDAGMVARLGGDEFLVLLPNLGRPERSDAASDTVAAKARAVIARIHACLSRPFALADMEFSMSASIGVSVFPIDAPDAETILKNASAAMYRSKKAGPGGHVLFASEPFDSRRRLSLATRLRRAVEEDAWVLHYQPLVDLIRGEITGVEALLRWHDPEVGLVLPDQFLETVEEMGLIERVGEWVMDRLLADWLGWREQGLGFDVAFNLSPRQLWRQDFVERLLSKIEQAHVDPTSLVVELTESAAMADADRTRTIMSSLRARGIRFALDDFGTGHSSLGRLRDLPVDILKIDRSFVRDLPHDGDAGTMVRAIIQLAHSLGMAPLAEGIESAGQWRFLLDQGCLLGQGYFFQRPAGAEEIAALCRRNGFRFILRETG